MKRGMLKRILAYVLLSGMVLAFLPGKQVEAASGWNSDSTGWWYEEGGWYPVSQWYQIGGYWYYFTASGYMDYSEYRDGCWLGADGAWNTAYSGGHWASDSKGWWYTDSSGWYPTSEWLWIDGYCYYFKSNGYMAANEMIDGCWLGANGAWDPNYKAPEEKKNDNKTEPEKKTPRKWWSDGYESLKGASSPYELYCIVIDYLNKGFHYDDLKDVFDPALFFAVYSKDRADKKDIFTYGLDSKKTYELVKALVDNSDVMRLSRDEEGEVRVELSDIEELRKGLPDDMQKQIDSHYNAYKSYAKDMYGYLYDLATVDGKSPFPTNQTVWKKAAEGHIKVEDYDGYHVYDQDFQRTFPNIIRISLVNFEEGYAIDNMGFYCIKMGEKYFFLDFDHIR